MPRPSSGILLALAGCLGCTLFASDGPTGFERTDIATGRGPSAVTAVDVSGDGVIDLLVANEDDGRVAILIGRGNGGFETPSSVAAGENPTDLALADFDEDGHLDLAVANHETSYLTLLRGDGAGAFEPFPGSPLALDVAPHPHAVAAADVDEDRRIDLVVDHRDAEGLLILTGKGDGRFDSAGVVPVGGDPYRGMALADLDGDSHLDIVTPNPREVAVVLGDGRGSFRRAPSPPIGDVRPFSVTTGDVDGDGSVDIVAGPGERSSHVTVALGNGDGTFRPAPGTPYATGTGASKVATADLDDDGADDVLVTSWDSSDLTIVYGGTAEPRTETVAVGVNPWGVTVADFDADGRLDVATANHGAGTVTVLLSRPQ